MSSDTHAGPSLSGQVETVQETRPAAKLAANVLNAAIFELSPMTAPLPVAMQVDECDGEIDEPDLLEEEWLDPPEFEDNLEIGEIQEDVGSLDMAEDAWQTVRRRLEERYEGAVPSEIAEALRKALDTLFQDRVDEQFEDILDGVQESLGKGRSTMFPGEADIVYIGEPGGKLVPVVVAGPLEMLLEQLVVEGGSRRLLWNSYSIAGKHLLRAIRARRENLEQVAEYLLVRQKKFFLSPDLESAMRCLNSDEQKSLAAVLKKEKSTVYRLLNGKFVQPPFPSPPLPMTMFFEGTPYNFIRESTAKAKSIGISSLTNGEYNLIYQILTGKKNKDRTMGNYLKKARQALPEAERPPEKKQGAGRPPLEDASLNRELADICTHVGQYLGLLQEGQKVGLKDVQRLRQAPR